MTTAPRLEKITPGNFDTAIGLKVRPDQEHLVAPVVKSLAEAYVYPGVAWPRLIVDGERTVGFLMAFFDINWDGGESGTDLRSGLWRLNIAAGEQGRGTAASRSRPWPPRSGAAAAPVSRSPGIPVRPARRASISGWDSS